MDNLPPKATPTRKFKPIVVGKCHVQTATDRFGPEAKAAIQDRERLAMGINPQGQEMPFVWPNPNGNDEDTNRGIEGGIHRNSIFRVVPSMQANRNNLTALSQLYNLYFVAYQGCIFVYRLRSGTQNTLPQCPDLLLRPAASDEARVIKRGVFGNRNAHTINHIITGQLGHEEIVLAAYDDGDVLAYKTLDAANYIHELEQANGLAEPATDSQSSSPHCSKRSIPKQFFHENVGKSAWGLAIHTQSRLIAVTSNRLEITVFAFALYSDATRQPGAAMPDEKRDDAEAWVRQRQRTWRIIILLNQEVDNMPNVCFLNNKQGLAEKVCAVDIKGAIWIADIWKPHQVASRIGPYDRRDIVSDEFYPEPSRGWGVLAFTDSCFMEVDTVEELVGFPKHSVELKQPRLQLRQPLAKIKPVLEVIPDNPCPPSGREDLSPTNDWIEEDDPPDEGLDEELIAADVNIWAGLVDGNIGGGIDDDFDDILGDIFQEPQEEGQGEGPMPQAVVNIHVLPGPAAQPQQQQTPLAANTAHLMQQLLQQSWPFEASLQELSTTLGELDEAFNELKDALPQDGFLPPLNGFAQQASLFQRLRSPDRPLPKPKTPRANPITLDHGLRMIYYPHRGEARPAPMSRKARILFAKSSRLGFNRNASLMTRATDRLAPGYRILRAYEKDFEMWKLPSRTLERTNEIGMFCGDVVEFQRFWDGFSSWSFRATSRLSLLAHVPELSLVILGSPTGRVLVASLTRMIPGEIHGDWAWQRGIRVEWVLPKASEEETYRQEKRPLHGMAIGRIPDHGDRNGEQDGRDASLPLRYRLMLHYQSHDIFSYEITRSEQTGKICMF